MSETPATWGADVVIGGDALTLSALAAIGRGLTASYPDATIRNGERGLFEITLGDERDENDA